VVLHDELHTQDAGSMTPHGLKEFPIIGTESPEEGLAAGKMMWPHGFHLRHLAMDPGVESKQHSRIEEEVILVQDGCLTVRFEEGDIELVAGDVLTVPVGKMRAFCNTTNELVESYVVRGGDNPAPPQIQD
jgi:mannose-6-phosphate isomerase-like protein (cupin superfamily)